MKRAYLVCGLIGAGLTVGCGKMSEDTRGILVDGNGHSAFAEQEITAGNFNRGSVLAIGQAPQSPPAAAADAPVVPAEKTDVPTAVRAQRKIVYQADIDLIVEDFSQVPAKLTSIVKQFDAFVSKSGRGGPAGSPRSGQWTIRVPVAHFDELLQAVQELGEVRKVDTRSQDMSEEYYDIEARIRNKKQEEARLLKLLEERTGELEDVLAVEREVSRVRGEVEQLEGRMRVLADLTSLSTVTLRVEEIKNYQPPEAAGFGTRVRRQFDGSVAALKVTGEWFVLFVVGAAPWLGTIGIPAIIVAIVLRRRITSRYGH
jgi:hypothetical protein